MQLLRYRRTLKRNILWEEKIVVRRRFAPVLVEIRNRGLSPEGLRKELRRGQPLAPLPLLPLPKRWGGDLRM